MYGAGKEVCVDNNFLYVRYMIMSYMYTQNHRQGHIRANCAEQGAGKYNSNNLIRIIPIDAICRAKYELIECLSA
jgi:hypothetical protein